MQRPEAVNLSREEGEALIERLEGHALVAADWRVLVQVLQVYFWLLFALQEATFSLKRLRALLFGDKPKQRQSQSSSGSSDGGDSAGDVEPRRRRCVARRRKTTALRGPRWPPSRPWASGRRGVSGSGAGHLPP